MDRLSAGTAGRELVTSVGAAAFPIAWAANGEHVGMVGKAIERGIGQQVVGKSGGPFPEGAVAPVRFAKTKVMMSEARS